MKNESENKYTYNIRQNNLEGNFDTTNPDLG